MMRRRAVHLSVGAPDDAADVTARAKARHDEMAPKQDMMSVETFIEAPLKMDRDAWMKLQDKVGGLVYSEDLYYVIGRGVKAIMEDDAWADQPPRAEQGAKNAQSHGYEAARLERAFYPRAKETDAQDDAFWKMNDRWRRLEAWGGISLHKLPTMKSYLPDWMAWNATWKTGADRNPDMLKERELQSVRAERVAMSYGYPGPYFYDPKAKHPKEGERFTIENGDAPPGPPVNESTAIPMWAKIGAPVAVVLGIASAILLPRLMRRP